MSMHLTIDHPHAKDFTLSIDVRPDDPAEVKGSLATGDPNIDQQWEQSILKKIREDDLWAWCRVVVTVTHNLFECSGEDSLFACSHKDFQDFKTSGYFEDMQVCALKHCIDLILSYSRKYETLQPTTSG